MDLSHCDSLQTVAGQIVVRLLPWVNILVPNDEWFVSNHERANVMFFFSTKRKKIQCKGEEEEKKKVSATNFIGKPNVSMGESSHIPRVTFCEVTFSHEPIHSRMRMVFCEWRIAMR